MASIGRTAYPRFRRVVSVRELQESFTPGGDEIGWARERTRSARSLLALVVLLKSFQRLGCFPDLVEVPSSVVEHVRGCLGLVAGVELVCESPRTAERHREGIVNLFGSTSGGDHPVHG